MLGLEHRSYLSHFGAILSNLSLALLAFCLVALIFTMFAWLVPALLMLGWIIAIVFSLGLLLLDEGFRGFFDTAAGSMDFIVEIGEVLWGWTPFAFVAGMICSVLSIVFILLDPSPKKSYWRVGISISVIVFLLLVVGIVIFAAWYASSGGAA